MKLTSRAKNLPQTKNDEDPRFCNVLLIQELAKRFNAVQNVAKTIRNKSNGNTQTTLRTGKHDFLLRQKVRGDTTPWGQIPPIKLDQNLPDFEIGLYKDIYVILSG